MFAIIKSGSVIGFVTDEAQKAFLIENEPGVSFAELSWPDNNTNPENFLMPSDVRVNEDGTVTATKE